MPRFGQLLQICLACRDDSDVHGSQLIRSQTLDLLLLQDAQELDLQCCRHAFDFVEKQRTAAGMLDLSDAAARSIGECAGLVAEHLALEQLFWYATAIDGNERLRAARAVLMQTAGNQLLAGSRFSLNEDVRGWTRQIENELSHAPGRGRTADN